MGDAESWREFAGRLTEHLKRFGHAVYDLDFAKSVPAEAPASLLETLKYFACGPRPQPVREAGGGHGGAGAGRRSVARAPGRAAPAVVQAVLRWAQRCAPLREDALADVGLGWPVLRRMLREVGRRMVAAGAIAERDDVFLAEVGRGGGGSAGARCRPARGRPSARDRGAARDLEAGAGRPRRPSRCPLRAAAGCSASTSAAGCPREAARRQADVIKGIGASPGRVTGPACVIHGPEEFDQMKPGDILVAKITTPAWTPLFALAAGIVTDVGGPLSHSSIVAREYGIPAVLGTGVATRRIRSGQHITVDGDGGLVRVDARGAMGAD